MFVLKTCVVKKKEKGQAELVDLQRPGVFSKDAEELVQLLIQLRHLDPDEHEVIIGMDDGQGSLKTFLIVRDRQDLEREASSGGKRAKYSDGVCPIKFKNTGVKKVLIIGYLPLTQENYPNVKLMLLETKIFGIEATMTPDIKLILIIQGRQGGSSKRNCPFGNGYAPWLEGDEECELLTVGDLFSEYKVTSYFFPASVMFLYKIRYLLSCG